MYTEEPRRNIDWGNLLKKGLIVVAIVAIIFLIVWLFTRNNSNAVNVNYDENNTNINETLNPNSYSEEFINNYRYFHDTAKEYFLISELPQSGSTLKYTLQELIDKGLMLPFSYNGETCDTEASYVTVSNNNDNYSMTTTLVCGTEVAKTTIELGCNQLCETGNCEKEEELALEYQYKQAYKATETTYSCPSGYTKNGTKCVKSDENTIEPTKKVTYNCPDGYTKSGDGSNTKCTKGTSSTIDATAKTTYSCASGYVLNGNKCYKTTKDSVDATAKTTYSCPDGYTKDGNKCTKEVTNTVDATPSTTYSCSSGTLSGNKCVVSSSSTIDATPSTTYSCSSGTLVNGKYCRINTTKSYYQSYTIYRGKTYLGCSYSGSYTSACSSYSGCTKTYYKYYCNKSSYRDVNATAYTTYSCPSGYTRNGSTCTKTTSSSVDATPTTTYSCSNGTLSGNKCIVSSSNTVDATAKTTYSCPSGYTKSGDTCYKTSEKSVNATKKTTYSCPEGYTKDGTKCTSTGTSTKNAIKNTTYKCASGYTKVGIGSTSICTKGSTTTIDATKSTKEVTKYKYKWSTETSLDGWEKTGKTRTSSN